MHAVGSRQAACTEISQGFAGLGVETRDLAGRRHAHAVGQAALEDRAEAGPHVAGGLQGVGRHDGGAVGGRDHETRIHVARQGHAVDQDAVRIVSHGRTGGGVDGRLAEHGHARAEEVVVVTDQEEVIVRGGGVEDRDDRKRLPLLAEGIGGDRIGRALGAHVHVDAEAGELRRIEQVDERSDLGGGDTGHRTRDAVGGRSVTRLVRGTGEVCRAVGGNERNRLEDQRTAVVGGTVTVTIAGEHQESGRGKRDDLRLGSGAVGRTPGTVTVESRKFDQVVADGGGRGGGLAYVIDHQTGEEAAVVGVERIILAGGALEHRHEVAAIRSEVDGFHSLVVATAAGLNTGGDGTRGGGETRVTRGAGELRQEGLRRGDETKHLAGLAHMVDRGAILIGDVEGPIRAESEAFAVDGELAAGGGDVAEALQGGSAGGIDRRGGLAGEVGDADRALQREGHLRLRDIVGRVVRREGQAHLMDARRVGDQTGDVVTTIRQSVERTGVAAVGVLAPGAMVYLEGREGPEGITAPVDHVGGEDAHADETLVDVVLATEGNRARHRRCGGVEERRTIVSREERRDGGGEEQGAGEVSHGCAKMERPRQSQPQAMDYKLLAVKMTDMSDQPKARNPMRINEAEAGNLTPRRHPNDQPPT